jgi:hypothetical protein
MNTIKTPNANLLHFSPGPNAKTNLWLQCGSLVWRGNWERHKDKVLIGLEVW